MQTNTFRMSHACNGEDRKVNELTTEYAARMCPECGADSFVYWTYEREDGARIRRRRCAVCGAKFETIEVQTRTISRGNKNLK